MRVDPKCTQQTRRIIHALRKVGDAREGLRDHLLAVGDVRCKVPHESAPLHKDEEEEKDGGRTGEGGDQRRQQHRQVDARRPDALRHEHALDLPLRREEEPAAAAERQARGGGGGRPSGAGRVRGGRAAHIEPQMETMLPKV